MKKLTGNQIIRTYIEFFKEKYIAHNLTAKAVKL